MIWHESFSLFDGPPMKIRQLNSRIISETEQQETPLAQLVPFRRDRQRPCGTSPRRPRTRRRKEGEQAAETSNPVAAAAETSSQQVEEEGAEAAEGGADLEKALD